MKPVKEEPAKKPTMVHAAILFAVFTAMFVIFFYFLDTSLGAGFGAKEILSALASSVIIALFLLWMRRMIRKNTYLGIAISIAGLVAFIYAFLLRFRGPNTTIFLIVFGIVYSVYIGYVYLRNRHRKNKYEYDDRL